MSISLERALKHMSWANQEVYKLIAVIRDGVTTHWMRSTIVTQAIHHATEHRAQAVSALEARGYKAVNLDDYDVWAYEIAKG